MLSANIVAQKPAGRVNPLSPFGHDGLLVAGSGEGWLWAEGNKLHTQSVVSTRPATIRFLHHKSNRIAPPRDEPAGIRLAQDAPKYSTVFRATAGPRKTETRTAVLQRFGSELEEAPDFLKAQFSPAVLSRLRFLV